MRRPFRLRSLLFVSTPPFAMHDAGRAKNRHIDFRKSPLSRHSFIAALLCLGAAFPAYADSPLAQATEQYANMCATQATNMPSPYGEADLKGNPKLADYCKCFGAKFAERALATVNNSKAPSLKETSAQEQAMRNTCRKQFGLPQLKF